MTSPMKFLHMHSMHLDICNIISKTIGYKNFCHIFWEFGPEQDTEIQYNTNNFGCERNSSNTHRQLYVRKGGFLIRCAIYDSFHVCL